MKRELVTAVAGVAVLVAGLSGCSSHPTAAAPKVTVGGQEQPSGSVACATHEGSTAITIGDPDHGVVATLTDADAPKLLSVVFGDVGGAKYMFVEDMPVTGTVTATKVTKDGKHYTLSGTASELEAVAHPASKPFEIDVTCP